MAGMNSSSRRAAGNEEEGRGRWCCCCSERDGVGKPERCAATAYAAALQLGVKVMASKLRVMSLARVEN